MIHCELIKKHRATMKMTQRELGALLDMHIQQICNIERGVHWCPAKHLKRICEALSIDRDIMFHAYCSDLNEWVRGKIL
jgi:DNA-binding XRE family transcriptional regulator